jgi:hypothetical protein
MNHSLHTNYQTSFRIVRKDSQTFYDVISKIFDWLCTKEKDENLKNSWKDFRYKGKWEHCYRTNARIQTATYIEDEQSRAWSMEYGHTDREIGAKRFWYTFAGVRDIGDAVIISARIAYSWNNEDLSAEPLAPPPSVPYFIRLLLKSFTTYSGRKEFRLIEKPLLLKNAGSGILVRDFIVSQDRRYPLIVFNGDTEPQKREAKRLSTELAGKVQVVILGSDQSLAREVKSAFPKEYNIGYEQMRVFFPMAVGKQSPKRHRWFDVRSTDYESQRNGLVHGLLRNHNLVEWDAVENILDIQNLISKAKITKLREAAGGVSEEEIHTLYQDYIKEIEGQRDAAKQEAEQYAQEVDQLESELRSFEWKSRALEQANQEDGLHSEFRRMVFKLPETLAEVVRMASVVHEDRITFAQGAFDSAEESSTCELVSDAWHILSHIATTLYDLRFNSKDTGDLGKQFQEKSGYEYARTEGKLTKADSKLTRQRKITHNGKEYEIWPHIKKGNDGNKMIRIHFDFDADDRKIVVGYVGLHMDNASTRGRK